jgi:hypothetical protein
VFLSGCRKDLHLNKNRRQGWLPSPVETHSQGNLRR